MEMKQEKHRVKEEVIRIGLALVIAIIAMWFVVCQMSAEAREQLWTTQESIAEDVLRFHIRANSDSDQDQALKLVLKDEVISRLQQALVGEQDLQATKDWAESNLESIEEICINLATELGYEYEITASVKETYFPTTTYGDVTFPAGMYEALVVEIGQADGANWWCCLYPELCFIDATYGVVPEEGKELLEEELTPDAYELITEPEKVKLSWFFFG